MYKRLFNQLNKILLVKFAGTFGSEMLQFAISLYILKRTGSALSMGVSLITGPLVDVVIMPFVGYIVDTVPHKMIMIVSQIVTSVSLLVFSLCFNLWPAGYFYILIGLIIMLEITDCLLSTTIQSSLIQLFPSDELQKVNSLSQSITSLAEFLAPILGAMLYTMVNIVVFADLEIIFEVIALLGILVLKFDYKKTEKIVDEEASEETANKTSIIGNFLDGFRYMLKQKLIFILTLSSGALNFFFASMNIGYPYLLVKTLKLSNVQYGMTDSAMAVGMILGGLILSKIHLRFNPIMFSYVALIVFSIIVSSVGLSTITNFKAQVITIIFIIINATNGCLLTFMNTPLDTFLQETVPPDMQGRVFNIDETLSTVLMPLGTMFFGVLFDHYNAVIIFFAAGAAMLLLAIVTIWIILKKDYLKNQGTINN
jgi:Major Facilitator Superfamily.